MSTDNYYSDAQRPNQTIEEHHAWLAARHAEFPPVRLAAEDPADEDEIPIYVDAAFAAAALATRGEYKPHVKRGPGRPRKHPV